MNNPDNLIKPFILAFILLLAGCTEKKTPSWQIAEAPLHTKWAEEITPSGAWQEYPRPQLVREEWLNLNGLWDYAIVHKDSAPEKNSGKILVPFPVESALSGVGKRIDQEHVIWYSREVKTPKVWKGKKLLLHFEAVDWEAVVWVNDKQVGTHRGGYDPFTFDITDYTEPGKSFMLKVAVWDPTDEGFQPRGKQVGHPRGIWYTPSSGIWQTVWMEPVAQTYVERVLLTPDIDGQKLTVEPVLKNPVPAVEFEVEVLKGEELLSTTRGSVDRPLEVKIPDPELWSPDRPFLYDLKMRLLVNNAVTDELISYAGMRKISVVKDDQGFNRLALNNKVIFQNGPLDQGFWPDGLNTPPSDEAMRFDIETTRAMGFNMLRKHVKIENRRFYYWCDKLGIMVWQDMPSAEGFIAPGDEDLQPSAEHRTQFEYELGEMISTLFNSPSIIMWVPFNEGWGQYDTRRIVEHIKSLDSTRLVNNASGWTDRGAGDVVDIHHYPDPRCPVQEESRASVLGEFGGLGLYVEGHTWQQENWGYEKMEEVDELLIKYEDFYQTVNGMKDECGLAACVYTQTTDVETETNGLMTYDRDRVKMGTENIYKAHMGIIPPRIKTPLRHFIDSITVELVSVKENADMQYCICSPGEEIKWRSYTGPFSVTSPLTLKTRSLWPDGEQSRENTVKFSQSTPFPSLFVEVLPGLTVSFFEGNWDKVPDFGSMESIRKGTSEKVDLSFAGKDELFGLMFEGYLLVPETDVYLFSLSSDDGALMFLDGEQFIDYDGIHGAGFRKSSRALEKGLHPFRLVYFQRYGGLGLNLYWESQRMEYAEIKPEFWKH